MTRNSGESSPSEAHPRGDVHESLTPANKPEWSAISRQNTSDNSQWTAARGGAGGDPSLDKKALDSGVLKFGSINDVINKSGSPADAAAKGQPTENFAPPARKGEGNTGNPALDKAATQDKAATLFSKDSTDEQKLTAARDMANSGMKNVSYRDSSGTEHNASLQVENVGNRQMVHVYGNGADGKEHTALRGISRADGTFEHERDRRGNFVDYKGKGFSTLAGDSQAAPSDVKPAPPTQPAAPGDAKVAPPAQPAAPGDVRPPRPEAQDRAPGSMDRSQFDAQLQDPRVMAAFAGRMNSEVGNQGHAAHVAFAEEVMNRAASRNQTVMQALTGSYYPTHNPGSSHNPSYMGAIKEAWKGGTDTIHGATGNASGTVGFGVRGGHYDGNRQWVSPNQTARIGGERFGHEQVDINKGWLQKYQQLKSGSPRI